MATDEGPERCVDALREQDVIRRNEPEFDLLTPSQAPSARLASSAGQEEAPLPAAALSRIGKYRIERMIARSENIIYEGSDPLMDRRVAIKELLLTADLDESEKLGRTRRFERDAQAAGRLSHPNIVTVLEVGEDNGHRFIAMEYLEGATVREALDQYGALPLVKALWIAVQVSEGLTYVHSRGIVHRDVRPDHVHVLRTGQVKLTGFGLALMAGDSDDPDGALPRNMPYTSPEQLAGSLVDHRADVFALGVMLYEMIAGDRPFTGENSDIVAQNIRGAVPPMLESLSPGLRQILPRALAKDPSQRYPTMAQMAADLRRERTALEMMPAAAPAPPALGATVAVSTFGAPGAAHMTLSGDLIEEQPTTSGSPSPAAGHAVPPQSEALRFQIPPQAIQPPAPNPALPPIARPATQSRESRAPAAAISLIVVVLAAIVVAFSYNRMTGGGPPPPMADGIVFDDSLHAGWTDGSWANDRITTTSPGHSGAHGLGVAIARSNGGVYFENPHFDPTGYKNLSFWINGGAAGCYNLWVQGVGPKGVPIPGSYPVPAVAPRTWMRMVIPLSTLKMNNTPGCTGFRIQDETGKAGQAFSLDDVSLERR